MPAGRLLGLLSVLAVLLSTPLLAQQSSPAQAGSSLRPLLPRDILRLDDIGHVSLSPDGLVLAYVLRKSADSVLEKSSKNSEYSASEEIWITPTRGGQPQKITDRLETGTIFTQVIFSPDSRQLAFVAVKNWDGSLWVCDLTSKQLKLLVAGRVNLGSVFERTLAWVSNQNLMYSLVPSGKTSQFVGIRESTEAATQVWTEARKGRSPSRSVIESGLNDPYENQTKGTLGLINVLTGAQQVVSTGDFNDMQVSPDSQYVAVLKQIGFHRPKANESLRHPSAAEYGFTVVTADGKITAETLKVEDVIPRSFSWSPDSTQLALAARPDRSDRPLQLFVYKPVEQKLTAIPGDDFLPVGGGFQAPPELAWTAKNELMVFGRKVSPKAADSGRTRPDWWILNANGPDRNLTEKMKLAPPRLISERNGESFLGVVEGELWRISSRENTPENLTRDFAPKVNSIAWPRQASPPTRNLTHIVLSVASGKELPGGEGDIYSFELNPGGFTSLATAPNSTLRDFSTASGIAIFTANDRTGTYLSVSEPGSTQTREILATNTFLRDVAEGALRKIQYRGLDGQDLVAWLILPTTYAEGSRYPLVVRVYAGTVYGDRPPNTTKLNYAQPFNLQLLASQGYAVLLPSMPLKPETEASDPFMELTKGVLPAVDKVIEMNIADPQRVGLFGQSFGGYSTYGLIAQTNRFKAAVSLAGLSNLISLYGQFNANDRYTNSPHDNSFHVSWSETGQGRLGNAPWRDVGRYVRNSPLFYVERVQTPLLIIQGDMDYVAMQQGEEFFTALYRQNKRARFVRYWGEGHVIGNNPANVTDMWKQIFDWFDTHLAAGSSRKQQP